MIKRTKLVRSLLYDIFGHHTHSMTKGKMSHTFEQNTPKQTNNNNDQ